MAGAPNALLWVPPKTLVVEVGVPKIDPDPKGWLLVVGVPPKTFVVVVGVPPKTFVVVVGVPPNML